MKNSKLRRALLLVASAVLLVCVSVGATLAYLTAETGVVTNTFTVGNVTIKLDEAKTNAVGTPVDESDKEISLKGDTYFWADDWTKTTRVTNNKYKLMPGHSYVKDPTVQVDAASEDCYLFVKVHNPLAAIEGSNPIASQMAANGWVVCDDSGVVDVIYYYTGSASSTTPKAVTKGTNLPVFTSLNITGDAHNDKDGEPKYQLDGYKNESITIVAYAIQADGLEAYTASQLWDAGGFGTN